MFWLLFFYQLDLEPYSCFIWFIAHWIYGLYGCGSCFIGSWSNQELKKLVNLWINHNNHILWFLHYTYFMELQVYCFVALITAIGCSSWFDYSYCFGLLLWLHIALHIAIGLLANIFGYTWLRGAKWNYKATQETTFRFPLPISSFITNLFSVFSPNNSHLIIILRTNTIRVVLRMLVLVVLWHCTIIFDIGSRFRNSGRPRTKEELFNHAHARQRNVIERVFGVLKARFPILNRMAPYRFRVWRDIVIACVAIYTFFGKEKLIIRFLNNSGEKLFYRITNKRMLRISDNSK